MLMTMVGLAMMTGGWGDNDEVDGVDNDNDEYLLQCCTLHTH